MTLKVTVITGQGVERSVEAKEAGKSSRGGEVRQIQSLLYYFYYWGHEGASTCPDFALVNI